MPRKRTTAPSSCETCGAEFLAWPSVAKAGGGRFCSRACYYRVPPGPVEFIDNNSAALIPLYRRDRMISGYVTVDIGDVEWASQWTWRLDNRGYASRGEGSGTEYRKILLHRELLGLNHESEDVGDHIDRDRLNCRRSNLRAIPSAGNQQNRPGSPLSTSEYRGVHWDKTARKWKASVRTNGRLISLGRFHDEREAANAARAARARLLPYATD